MGLGLALEEKEHKEMTRGWHGKVTGILTRIPLILHNG